MINKKPINAIEDLCVLTTIPTTSMNKLFDQLSWCICNGLCENILDNQEYAEINIGVGNLIISIEDNMLQYKFIPNAKLEQSLVEAVVHKKNALSLNVESAFIKRITNTYKDMF